MSAVLEITLWWAAAASLFLPVLSFSGYPITSIEYLSGGLLALILAAGCHALSSIRWLRSVVLLAIVVILSVAYYSGLITSLSWAVLILVIFSVGVFIVVHRDFSAALRVVGVAGAVQIAAAAISTPGLIRDNTERSSTRANRPSVIHLVLDEHVGIGAIPDAFAEQRRRLEGAYVAMGFVVFRRAYTIDKYSHESIARIVNPGIADPKAVLRLLPNANRWIVTQSTAFDRIADNRALDLTYFDYVSYGRSVLDQAMLARLESLDSDVAIPSVSKFQVPLTDRIIIATSKALAWFKLRAKSPITNRLLENTKVGRSLWTRSEPTRRTHPIVSRDTLLGFIDRLACCGDRGTYYFLHVYLPHYPYVFDDACRLRPVLEWRTRVTDRIDEPDTLETRQLRYALHVEQAACVVRDVESMAVLINSKPELRDATIIVHSDHGSRISIEDRSTVSEQSYDERAYERDWRGAFFAVKIPGHIGSVVDRPVRVDAVYEALLQNDFGAINVDAIANDGSEPY